MNHLGRSTDFRQSKGETCIDAPAGNSFDEWGFAQGNPRVTRRIVGDSEVIQLGIVRISTGKSASRQEIKH